MSLEDRQNILIMDSFLNLSKVILCNNEHIAALTAELKSVRAKLEGQGDAAQLMRTLRMLTGVKRDKDVFPVIQAWQAERQAAV